MKTMLITGVGSGLGRAFAVAALAAGHRVVGTLRNPQGAKVFEELAATGRAHALILDVTDDAAVFAAVANVEETVAPLDVVIANAGYGVEGVFEETPLSQWRAQFAVNVFGVVATLQASLPFMRARRAGHLMAVTSMGGLVAVPGMSAYCASKFAVEGMLESLRKETSGFGVRVTAIEPGSFRTDWAGRSMTRTDRAIADYDTLFDPIRAARLVASGNQLGDPEKAAQAVLELVDMADPPAHLVLGSDALRLIVEARAAVDEDIRRWDGLSRSTDFDDRVQPAAVPRG